MGLEIHLYLFDKSTHQRSQLPLGALNILQSLNIFALIKLVQCFVSKKKCIPVERIQADKCFDPVIQVQTNIDTPINQVKEQMKCFELQSYRRPEKPFNQGQARLQKTKTPKKQKVLFIVINNKLRSNIHSAFQSLYSSTEKQYVHIQNQNQAIHVNSFIIQGDL